MKCECVPCVRRSEGPNVPCSPMGYGGGYRLEVLSVLALSYIITPLHDPLTLAWHAFVSWTALLHMSSCRSHLQRYHHRIVSSHTAIRYSLYRTWGLLVVRREPVVEFSRLSQAEGGCLRIHKCEYISKIIIIIV